jgi:hypothetical protein
MRRHALMIAAVLTAAALALAGCGESDSEQADEAVCDARAGIQTAVDDLGTLTPTTATVDQVRGDIESIQADLATIEENRDQLDEERRAQVTAATDEFTAELRAIASGLTSDLSLQGAEQQFRAALASLETAYRSSLQQIDCG